MFSYFHRAPQALGENVVHAPALAIHANLNLVSVENIGVLGACEMAALVRIMDGWYCDPERIVEIIQTELFLQRIREVPCNNISAVPVHEGDQITESLFEPHVCDVGSLDLIGASDDEMM